MATESKALESEASNKHLQEFSEWQRQSPFLLNLKDSGYLKQFSSASEFLSQVHIDSKNEGWAHTDKGDLGEALYWAKAVVVDKLTTIYHHTNIPQEIKDRLDFSVDGNENGIDFVVVDNSGEECAVQVKLYKKDSLVKEDIDSFFSEASNFKSRLVVTSTAKITRRIAASKYSSFKKHDWELLSDEDWQRMVQFCEGDGKSVSVKKWDWKKEQDEEMIPQCIKGLKARGRSVAVAPTAFGKTIGGLKIQEKLNTKVNLVASHRIELSNQWVQEIIKWIPNARVCLVYSEKGLVVDGYDDSEPVLKGITDPAKITAWHQKNKNHKGPIFYVLVYDSLPQFINANIQIDYAIIDEAHHTEGRPEKHAAQIWDENKIKIKYRLATTATPHPPMDAPNISLYNEDICGQLDFYKTDREAEDAGLINSSRNILHVITDAEIDRDSGFAFLDGTPVQNFRAALIVGIKNIVESKPDAKVLVTHGGIPAARSFSGNAANGLKAHVGEDVWTGCVYSGQQKAERKRTLSEFKHHKGPAVLSHCNILTEGYDEPSINVTFWASPTKSEIKARQKTGRGLRIYEGKGETENHVLVLHNEGAEESIDEALNKTNFDTICEVLSNRLDPDGVWNPERDFEASSLEERELILGYTRRLIDENWDVRGNITNLDDWRKAMETRVLSQFISSWSDDYQDIVDYVATLPEARINPETYSQDFPSTEPRAIWIKSQQQAYKRKTIPESRKELLEKIDGWFWNDESEKINASINLICEHLKNEPYHRDFCIMRGKKSSGHGYCLLSRTKRMYPAKSGKHKKVAAAMDKIRNGEIKLTEAQVKKLKDPFEVGRERRGFDFRTLSEYRIEEATNNFNKIYDETGGFFQARGSDMYRIYDKLRLFLKENDWKVWDADALPPKPKNIGGITQETANVYREIILGVEAGAKTLIEFMRGRDGDERLEEAVEKAKASFDLHGHLIHLDTDTKEFILRRKDAFSKKQINDLTNMLFEWSPLWYMEEKMAMDILFQIQSKLCSYQDPHILEIVTEDVPFDELVEKYDINDSMLYVVGKEEQFDWRPDGWKPTRENTGAFSERDWPVFGYFKMRWPLVNRKTKGSQFPQTWLFDMLFKLRRNSHEFYKKLDKSNQIKIAESWQKQKERLFRYGAKRHHAARSVSLEIDYDSWCGYNQIVYEKDGKQASHSKGYQVEADFARAMDNNELYYLPAKQKAWCEKYLDVQKLIQKRRLEGVEHYWELGEDVPKERSWMVIQRRNVKDGKSSKQQVELLNKGDMALALNTSVADSNKRRLVGNPKGSWQDPDTGEWCMKCSECDEVRRVKHWKVFKEAGLCRSCGNKSGQRSRTDKKKQTAKT